MNNERIQSFESSMSKDGSDGTIKFDVLIPVELAELAEKISVK